MAAKIRKTKKPGVNRGAFETQISKTIHQAKREILYPLLIGAVYKHIVKEVFGEYTKVAIPYTRKAAILKLGEMEIVKVFNLTVLGAFLFQHAINQKTNFRTNYKMEAFIVLIRRSPEIERQGQQQIIG